MRAATLLLTLCLSCQSCWAIDYSWLTGQWSSDADATVQANAFAAKLDATHLAQFKGLFGRTVWSMQNGELTISHDKLAVNSARYFIRPGDAQHFEILIKDSTSEADFSALRTNEGFCVNMRWLQVNARRTWVRSAIAECFVRAG